MKKTTAVLLVPVAASTMMFSACGSKSSSSSSSDNTTAAAGSTATTAASSGTATASASCPTSNSKAFAKTRFVTDVGLAAGTFHRYIYKPYQAGSFNKGAKGRVTTIAKGAAVAAIDVHLINNAYDNVQASPALCKVLIKPMGELKTALGGLKGNITSGNLGAIASVESLVKSVEGTASKNGAAVSENTDLTAAQSATKQG